MTQAAAGAVGGAGGGAGTAVAGRRRPRTWPWLLLAVAFLGPLLLWPLAAIVWRGLSADGALSAESIRNVLEDPYTWERLWFTTWQAAASTALALLAGLAGAWAFALHRFPGRSVLLAVFTVPFVLPTLVVALAFQQLLGPQGWVNDVLRALGLEPLRPLGTIWAILAAHVFYNVAIVVRLVGGVWTNLDPATEEAARVLGAGRWQAFRHVTLPALLPALGSAAALVFVFTFTSFGVVLVLGGPGLETLEVVIYRLTTRLVQLPAAAVLALVQIAATLVALLLYAALQGRLARTQRVRRDRARPLGVLSWSRRSALALVLVALGALLLTPMAALVHGALTLGAEGPLTGRHFAALFEDTGRISYVAPLDAVRWSLTFAFGAAIVAVLAGVAGATALASSRGRLGLLADGLLMLPLAVPAVVLGFGYLITFNRDPFDLRASPWLVLAAHALIGYPFVVRATLPVLRGMDPRLVEAARTLGAGPWRAWRRVVLPLALRGVLAGALFAFAISLGEFGATAVLQRREFATMPIAIFEALGRPGFASLGRALAMSVVLMAVTALSFLAIERLRFRDIREF